MTLNEYVNGLPEALTANAGDQTSRGIDAQFGAKPIYNVSPYVSFEYLDSHTGTNVPAPSVLKGQTIHDYLPTKGKVSTQAPRFQVALGLTYADGPFTAGVRLRWVGRQYADLMNEESMPSYLHNDFTFAYALPDWSMLHNTKLQLNISNIGNGLFRTGVNYAPLNAATTIGTLGGTIGSSTPTYYVEPSFAAAFSLSTAF